MFAAHNDCTHRGGLVHVCDRFSIFSFPYPSQPSCSFQVLVPFPFEKDLHPIIFYFALYSYSILNFFHKRNHTVFKLMCLICFS